MANSANLAFHQNYTNLVLPIVCVSIFCPLHQCAVVTVLPIVKPIVIIIPIVTVVPIVTKELGNLAKNKKKHIKMKGGIK